MGSLRARILDLVARPRAPQSLPVKIGGGRGSRVYVMPTGAGLLLYGMLISIVLSALNYDSNAALGMACVIAVVAIIALIRGHMRLDGMTVVAASTNPGHEGDTVDIRVDVQCKTPTDNIMLLCGGSQARFVMDDQGRGVATVSVRALQRGAWSVPRLCIASRGPLGLATAWTWVWPSLEVVVWPGLEDPAPMLPDHHAGQQQRTSNSGDVNEDVRSLRAYRPGDPLRRVAWKQSARLDRPVVREFDAPAGTCTIDWDMLGDLDTEARLKRMATWVVEADRCGRTTRVVLPGTTIGPDSGHNHKQTALEAMARVPR